MLKFVIAILLILIGILIPAGIYVGLLYIFGFKYMWYYFGVIYSLVFAFNVLTIFRKPKIESDNKRG